MKSTELTKFADETVLTLNALIFTDTLPDCVANKKGIRKSVSGLKHVQYICC